MYIYIYILGVAHAYDNQATTLNPLLIVAKQ
jgi:hypothetical protein